MFERQIDINIGGNKKISAQLPPKASPILHTEFTLGYQPNSIVMARLVGGGQRQRQLTLAKLTPQNI